MKLHLPRYGLKGRMKLPPKRRLKDRVNIYLELETIEAAQERAVSLGLSLSSWVRLLMLKELEDPRIFRDE